MSHDARYRCCSAVSRSTSTPIAASLSRAISRSTASGTRWTVARREQHGVLKLEYSAAKAIGSRNSYPDRLRVLPFGRGEIR